MKVSCLPFLVLALVGMIAVLDGTGDAAAAAGRGRLLAGGAAAPAMAAAACDSMFCGESFKISLSLVIMCTVIVIFSICMEKFVMEPMKEEEDENMKPIVNTMFSELTLLGFVGLFMFIVEKLDLLSGPSYRIFQDKEMMAELFEDVHMIVFLVMVLFLFNAFCLLRLGKSTVEMWKKANTRCIDEPDLIVAEYAKCLKEGTRIDEARLFRENECHWPAVSAIKQPLRACRWPAVSSIKQPLKACT